MSASNQDPYALIGKMAYQAIDAQRRLRPEVFAKYKGVDNEHCVRDTQYHFRFLLDAVNLDAPELFVSYVAWCRVLLKNLNIEPAIFLENLQFMQKEVRRELTPPLAERADSYLQSAIERFSSMRDDIPTFIDIKDEQGKMAEEYLEAVLHSDRAKAQKIIRTARAEGMGIREIYLNIFQVVQYEVGRRWQMRQVSVAQEHFATAVSQQLMSQMYPDLLSGGSKKGIVVMTCVGEELHEMGARMVSDFLELDGWDVNYLGSNIPVMAIIAYLRQVKADLLMVSATMGYNVKNVRELVQAIRADPGLADVKIVVGGYPFNQVPDLWRQVGANGFASDADQVIATVNGLVKG